MNVVRYRCPDTDEEVTTAIETGNDVLFKMRSMDLKIWVWCPHCMAGHTIASKDAILDDHNALAETELSPADALPFDTEADREVR